MSSDPHTKSDLQEDIAEIKEKVHQLERKEEAFQTLLATILKYNKQNVPSLVWNMAVEFNLVYQYNLIGDGEKDEKK